MFENYSRTICGLICIVQPALIMREYLHGVARNTYYKYKKEIAIENKGLSH